MRWAGPAAAAVVILVIGSGSHSSAQEGGEAGTERDAGTASRSARRPGSGAETGTGAAAGSGRVDGSGSGTGTGTGTGPAAGSGRVDVSGSGGARPEAEGVTVPAGWRRLAELAGAIPAQPGGAPVKVESRQGWGDPARGCFAVQQRVSAPARGFHLGRAQAALLQAMRATGLTAGPNAAELPFVGRGVQGRIRSSTQPEAGDRIAVVSLACFYNDREPDQCRSTCDAMLDSAGTGR